MTSRFAVVGTPVAHSLSPTLFGAVFSALGLSARYEAIAVPTDDALRQLLARFRADPTWVGLNVTMPYKESILSELDELEPGARDVSAVNVVAKVEDQLVGHNSDVTALSRRISHLTECRGGALVLGSGGAAKAAVIALEQLQFDRIYFMARSARNAEWMSERGVHRLQFGQAPPDVLGAVIQTTGYELGPTTGQDPAEWVPWSKIHPDGALLDVVYRPALTGFMRRAQGIARVEGGLPMLIAQAERSFEIWLRRKAPEGLMAQVVSGPLVASS